MLEASISVALAVVAAVAVAVAPWSAAATAAAHWSGTFSASAASAASLASLATASTSIPASWTAALISSSVTSGTRRFSVKIQPSSSPSVLPKVVFVSCQ